MRIISRLVVEGVGVLVTGPSRPDDPTAPSALIGLLSNDHRPAAQDLLPLDEASYLSQTLESAAVDDPAALTMVSTLLQAAAEVVSGRRPANQLHGLVPPEAAAALAAWSRRIKSRAHTASVRAYRVHPNLIEGFGRIEVAERSVAASVTLRRDPAAGRWICTQLTVLTPGVHLSVAA